MEKVRAVVIDPWKRTIEFEEVGTDWREIQRALSRNQDEQIPLCTAFRARTPQNGLHAYVDDEGLFRNGQAFFEALAITGNPLAGRCVIFGDDPMGEEAPVPDDFNIDELRALVKWIDRDEANDLVQPTVITHFDRDWVETGREVLGKIDLTNPGPAPSSSIRGH